MTGAADIAVRVENLAKLYRIGARLDNRTFRETITDTLTLRRRRNDAERDLWALRDVSFEVKRGEAVGIIGQNGAGKSTLLKILSRITEPTRGRVEVRGRVSSLLEVGTGFHPELTGRENIALNGAILGMTRAEIRHRFDDIVAFAEVERFIDTPVKYYSSGMYMRLAFAVAAHLEPEILVVDEVLAVGDAAFQSKCLRKMNDVASHGRTVLFVSHNMPAVKSLCQTAVWLRNGEVVDRGPSDAIVTRYLQHSSSRAGREGAAALIASLPPDPQFRLDAIRLMQRGDEITNALNGEPLEIEIEFEVFTTTLGLHVYFQLLDLEETVIFESIHNGSRDEAPRVEAGRWLARATIPADFLAARPYQLLVFAGVADVRALLPEPIRLTFDVQQSGIVNRAFPGYQTPGKIAPLLQWDVTRRER
ncbi:MAG TPA: polysaccharide ABC transporter ATP-binding protein [Thermoanaerobaculia bacterium]|nr:polysaccharide ABC transporter ATP-binding protein [Thermoanaerobaculia bacterium]